MEQIIIYLALVLFGLVLGSFAGASIWRLRASQLIQDKKDGERVDCVEYKSLKKLAKNSILNDRSRCLHCSYVLRWYDLIPLFSWLSLGGKCRKCHEPIGYLEPAIEICVALFFVISYMFWPVVLVSQLEIARFIIWLLAGVALAILFVYDAKWYLLPNRVNFTIIGFGVINAILAILSSSDRVSTVVSIIGSVAILSGIYWGLYQISSGKWIGFGDIKLGLGLALLLADWKLAFIALFAANLVGCMIVLPSVVTGKLKRDSHIPFGPLLIVGYILAGLYGHYLINLLFL
ncbi:MAG: prepilin peptidase [Candidatus Saccharibacteria bacterium]